MKKFAIILLAVTLVASAAYADKLSDLHGPTVYVPLSSGNPTLATGDDCTDPIAFGSLDLPYNDLNTTCGRLNSYDATCLGSYDGGEDIIYEMTLDALTYIDIAVTTDATWVGLAIFDGCPDVGNCLDFATSSAGDQSLTSLALAAGTYYIMVDTYPSPTCILNLELLVTLGTPPGPGESCGTAVPAVELLNSCPGAPFWYSFEAPIDGCLWISSCIDLQTVDTYVYAYSDCVGTLLGSDDDDLGDVEACAYSFASYLDVPVAAGDVVFIYFGDNYSTLPFDWNLYVTDCVVATEEASWGSIKSLFR